VRRREFITLLGGAAAWPVPARGQPGAKVARIGYLVTASLESPEGRAMADAFRQGLRERGYVEGQSIIIEYRSADGRIERFPELANELASVCTENSVLIDYVTESPNVSGDDRSVMLVPDRVRLAVQVEAPT
jgi:hypothetical protein